MYHPTDTVKKVLINLSLYPFLVIQNGKLDIFIIIFFSPAFRVDAYSITLVLKQNSQEDHTLCHQVSIVSDCILPYLREHLGLWLVLSSISCGNLIVPGYMTFSFPYSKDYMNRLFNIKKTEIVSGPWV